jgi:UV DNA damage repair endonuclease
VPKKGQTNNPNGRPKGSPNKATKTVREHFAHAFNLLQESDTANLHQWAQSNPTEFYRLASKLIPMQVSNDPENPMPSVIIQIIPDPECKPIE